MITPSQKRPTRDAERKVTPQERLLRSTAERLVRDAERKWGLGWTMLSTEQQTAEVCRAIVAILVGMDDETCSHNPALGRLQRISDAALAKVGGEP